MASDPFRSWANRTVLRTGREEPYLSIQDIVVFVRDLEVSKRFYVNLLGFELITEQCLPTGVRWIEVAPPDGSANLALVEPKPDRPEYKLIGGYRWVLFMTEDVQATYKEWSERGVHFLFAPETPGWGGTFARFEDPDGNAFGLEGFGEVKRSLESRRRTQAEKLESERRTAHELDIAKQVQARLFPQNFPPLRTLDYAGVCIQARQVGGDYYDFLNLGQDRVGLVLGDIAGKGIAGALLMANLQANLRSQCTIACRDPQRLLRSVNDLFYDNTADHAYATLFFAEYDDPTRRMRYANCGHLPALVLRGNNSLDRLASTCTVLGLFKDWDCPIVECQLFEGDIIAFYTDGITESFNAAGEEFGEQRLSEALLRNRELPSRDLLSAIVDEVRQFNVEEQHDDITLIIAKCGARHRL